MRGSLVYLLSLRRSVAGDSEQEGFLTSHHFSMQQVGQALQLPMKTWCEFEHYYILAP